MSHGSRAFSSIDALQVGWRLTREHWRVLLVPSAIALGLYILEQALANPNATSAQRPLAMLIIQALQLMNVFLFTRVALRVHDGTFIDWRNPSGLTQGFVGFAVTSFLWGLITMAGLLLLVVPGVFWLLQYGLAPIIAADRSVEPALALSESRRLTDGVKWQLLAFALLVCLLNGIGTVALGLGLLLTLPISYLATIHIFRSLEKAARPVTFAPESQTPDAALGHAWRGRP